MKLQVMFLLLLAGAVLLAGCAQQLSGGNQTPTQQQNQTPAANCSYGYICGNPSMGCAIPNAIYNCPMQPANQTNASEACVNSGGTVTTQLCCGSVGDFPNTCLIGACGCSPSNSHEVEYCDCGAGKCWDNSKNQCVAAQAQPENNTPPENNTQPTVEMNQIYNYSLIHSYEYTVTTASSAQIGSMDLKTTVTPDTVNGIDAWMEQTNITMEGASVISDTWIDKVTYQCLKMSTIIDYGGQPMEQPGSCPTTGLNSASQVANMTMTFVGTESVTVPAGTFNCNKYSLSGVTYWSASGVPVPVKVAYSDGSMTMELVSYS
jgi:hypothetical protein